MKPSLPCLLLIPLLFSLPAVAAPEVETEVAPPVNFFVYTWPLPDSMGDDAFFSVIWRYQTPEAVRDINLHDGSLSGKMVHPAGVPLVLFQEIPVPDAEPIRQAKLRIGTEILGEKKQVLIIMFPLAIDPQTGLHRTHLIDLSPETLPAGSVKILNLADRDVVGQIGDVDVRIPRFQEHVTRSTSDSEGVFIARFAAVIEGDPQFVYSTRRRLNPDQSYVMLLLNENRGNRLAWNFMSFGGLAYEAPPTGE